MTVGPVASVYGPAGKRLKKLSASGTTLYLGADVELANGVWTKYLHADVKVVGTSASAVTSWLHRDHLASVRKITNASGGVAEATAYKPYGKQTSAELTQSKTFIGEKWDPETGLMYLNARYYAPVLARFMATIMRQADLRAMGTRSLGVRNNRNGNMVAYFKVSANFRNSMRGETSYASEFKVSAEDESEAIDSVICHAQINDIGLIERSTAEKMSLDPTRVRGGIEEMHGTQRIVADFDNSTEYQIVLAGMDIEENMRKCICTFLVIARNMDSARESALFQAMLNKLVVDSIDEVIVKGIENNRRISVIEFGRVYYD